MLFFYKNEDLIQLILTRNHYDYPELKDVEIAGPCCKLIKKSMLGAITLFAYLIILIVHVVQLVTLPAEFRYLVSTLSRCLVIDFVFILVTFFSYLWVDDIEAKTFGKKSVDNTLDWFWKKI